MFQSVVAARRAQVAISSLEIDGSMTPDPNAIENHVIDYYKDLFGDDDSSNVPADVDQVIPSLVSSDENDSLLTMPIFSEIRKVVKGMDGSSTLGLDGFTGDFYSHCWDIIEYDVCTVVRSFFVSGFVESGLNSCNMVQLYLASFLQKQLGFLH